MAEKVLMIALSPTMEEGVIVKWNKQEGDTISSGDVICEVETDKATMEYESAQEGILLKIIVGESEKAGVGDVIAVIGEKGEDINELIKEIENEKKSEKKEEIVQEDKTIEIKNKPIIQEPPKPKLESNIIPLHSSEEIIASPLARKIAQEKGVDIRNIQGSGPHGRIIKRDVESEQTGGVKYKPIVLKDEVISVSTIRRRIAERISESKYSAPHYYLKLSVVMDNLMNARQKLNKKRDKKISFNAFLIKFVAETLKKHPLVNATWNDDIIIKHGKADIGLAVALTEGLITPVVRDCGNKGIIEIDEGLQDLINKAFSNKLMPEEFKGASFTISNLGSFGIEEFTAIINPPGSAILAVGMTQKEPVVGENDQLNILSKMKLTLSCDHRVIDGAVGAAFLKDLKDMIEYPVEFLY